MNCMNMGVKAALALAVTAIILYLLSDSASAQASACGVGGTAKSASGTVVTRTDEQAKKDNVRIGPDGYWWKCPAPKPPSVNLDCPLSGGTMPSWYGDDGSRCTAGVVIRGPKKHGERFGMLDTSGPVIGYQRMRCDDGILVSEYRYCRAK